LLNKKTGSLEICISNLVLGGGVVTRLDVSMVKIGDCSPVETVADQARSAKLTERVAEILRQ
jgi:hypothetical protein